MKKKLVYLFVSVAILSNPSISLANEIAENKMGANVVEGEFSITSSNGNLNFGSIKPLNGRGGEFRAIRTYNPTIDPEEWGQKYEMAHYDGWSGNEYDPDYEEGFSAHGPDRIASSMLTIKNSNVNIHSYKINLSRTPFKDESGNEMRGENLYMGKFQDNAYGMDNPNQRTDDKNYHHLAEYATITERNSLIAEFSGEHAKGEHYISPLSFTDDVYQVEKLAPYRDKNITLVTDTSTYFPSSGNYTATLVWTVEFSPW